jgi:hypothetical protein
MNGPRWIVVICISCFVIVVSSISGGSGGFILGVLLSCAFTWLLQCLVYIQDLRYVPVHNRLRDVVTRLLSPGFRLILWPIEKLLPPISTKTIVREYVLDDARSSDCVALTINWWVRYQLAPNRLTPAQLPATIHLLTTDPQKHLELFSGIALRSLINQKTAEQLTSSEGWRYLNRFFPASLRREAEREGFFIISAAVEHIGIPHDIQDSFNQAAGIEVELWAVEKAGQGYTRMANRLSPEQMEWIRQMELLRTVRKGGHNSHFFHT